MSVIGNTFSNIKIRSFLRDDLLDAWDWLREGNQEDDSSPKTAVESEKRKLEPYTHIIVAVDFSPHSSLALTRAVELAQRYNANPSLIHAIEHITYTDSEYDSIIPVYDYIERDQAIFDHAVSRLDEITNSQDYPNIQHEVLWGNPKSTILSYVAAQNGDLIVAGSHGRHGLARLLGSTANGIVHSAKCDVMVVRLSEL